MSSLCFSRVVARCIQFFWGLSHSRFLWFNWSNSFLSSRFEYRIRGFVLWQENVSIIKNGNWLWQQSRSLCFSQVVALYTQFIWSSNGLEAFNMGSFTCGRIQAAPSPSGNDSGLAKLSWHRGNHGGAPSPGGCPEFQRCWLRWPESTQGQHNATTPFKALQRPAWGGGAESRRRRVPAVLTQASPSPSGFDSGCVESTQRRHQKAAPSPGDAELISLSVSFTNFESVEV